MKGSETQLMTYLEGSKKRFVIPVYQRNYEWKRENCAQLFDDLIDVARNGRSSHFFGSVVSSYQPNGRYIEYLVIDGQQRLTTVSLLLLAMYNLIKQGKVTPGIYTMADEIHDDYLVDKHQPRETRIKLKPVKGDQAAYGSLFEDDAEVVKQSNLTTNYEYFYTRIQKEEITIDQLYNALFALVVINIELTAEDNPQRIFESLNSTGVALSEGDKIRNYILMGLSARLQEEYYETYWHRIEMLTGYQVSMFVRDYLSVRQQMIPALDRVYVTFKSYVQETQPATEVLLKELLAYARWYEVLLKGKTPNRQLSACIDRLNRLETTVTRPFFLEVLRLQSEAKLSWAEVCEIFAYTENYLFRRTICDLPTNALNKIFLTLHREIVRYDGTDANYLEKFKYALLSKVDRARFPEDGEFAKALSTRLIYKMHSRHKVYLLERLENFGTVEDKAIYQHVEDGTYSIEHIMPQHLTPAWMRELGDNYASIHEEWLHRLANLTLTGYNAKYSNSPFSEKRDTTNGFADSGLRMNVWIAQQNAWGLAELEARSNLLVNRALQIWSVPSTTFAATQKPMESCTLEDDVDLSGRDIARFSFQNTEQPVQSWADMMERLMKMLHADDPAILTRLAFNCDPEDDLYAWVSNNPSDLRRSFEVDAGIFVERNTSTATKINLLRKFFKAYDVNPGDLVFFLRDASDIAREDEAGTRFELRRRYWAFALPFIQQAHGPNRCFSGCTGSKENWISGYFGISSFSIICIANYNEAQVKLYLNKADQAENKATFDYLYGFRNTIEAELGAQLRWERNDDNKASQIAIHLADVSISQESDWTQMAKFHAERSKKFFDVFVPYLRRRYGMSSE